MKSAVIALGLVFCFTLSAHATVVIAFDWSATAPDGTGNPAAPSAGVVWDGKSQGQAVGPFTDGMTGLMGTITLGAITDNGSLAIENKTANSTNPNQDSPFSGGTGPDAWSGAGFGLGINSDPGDPSQLMNNGESFSFVWDMNTEFAGISMRPNFDDGDDFTERFTVSSPAWSSLSITPGDAEVSFSSGTFTFTPQHAGGPGEALQVYTAADLGGVVPLAAGQSITIGFNSTLTETGITDGAGLRSISFNVVPEVSSFLFGCVVCCVLGLGYGRRQRLDSDQAG